MTGTQGAARWARRLTAMTWKEVLQLSRDVPLLLFLLYSFSLSVLVSGAGITMQLHNADLLVHDADHSLSSRELIHRFQPPYFQFDGEVSDPRDGLRELEEGTAMLLLDIPPRFHEALVSGERTAVQLLVDTTNAPQGLSAAAYTVRIAGGLGTDMGLASVGLSGAKGSLPMVAATKPNPAVVNTCNAVNRKKSAAEPFIGTWNIGPNTPYTARPVQRRITADIASTFENII